MSQFWNRKTRSLTPYIAGEQPRPGQKVIKLNTNENPYPPSPRIAEFLQTFDPATLRLYPEPTSQALREALADFFGVRPEQVFCGNGSDEVLAFSFQAFFETQEGAKPLLIPDISYSFYPVYAKLYGIPLEQIPLCEDFSIPTEKFCVPSGGVAIATPNAPTSLALPIPDIRRILESQSDRVVIIDQAYAAFDDTTGSAQKGPSGAFCTELLPEFPNLLIIGTLSKSHSLAGLRVGFAIASEELIEGLQRVRDSFNSYPVDTIALHLATIAVRDLDYYEESTRRVIRTREAAAAKMSAMGFLVLDAKSNFLFVKPAGIPAEELYKKLRATGILVRYFSKPRICDYLRISIGTDEDMDTLLSAIEIIIRERKEEIG
jgi:histidinol-phosphate aminotransferase